MLKKGTFQIQIIVRQNFVIITVSRNKNDISIAKGIMQHFLIVVKLLITTLNKLYN